MPELDDGTPMPAPVRQLLDLVGQHREGISVADLSAAARARFPGLAPARIAVLLTQALDAGALTEDGGILSLPPVAVPQPGDGETGTAERGIRVVVVDLESVVRTTDVAPYTDKRIYQVGAVRAGTDPAWTAAAPRFERFLDLPDDTWEIRSGQVRARQQAEGVAPGLALADLHEFCAAADLVVTYNGTVADMPLLAVSFAREGLPTLDLTHVDAYYLTLALWPDAATHSLAGLCDEVGVDRAGLAWHDAVADARLLERLLGHGAGVVAAWPPGLRSLVASVCPDSPGWTLLLALAGGDNSPAQMSPPQVAAVLSAQLGARTPRRAAAPGAGRARVVVPALLLDEAGRVDPGALAVVARGGSARVRPAQQQMSTAIHAWADAGIPALVEAPTGTGKSYAVLACALDWLAGGSDRTAIITTFTKQLQAQLAADVVALDAGLPGLGLLGATDVVKGAGNRLSLRALTGALADATSLAGARGASEANRFLAQGPFRELLVYLALRFLAATGEQAGSAARSVDGADMPAFFTDYLPAAAPVWLASLSQGDGGEYQANAGTPLAAHTDMVTEALFGRRLLLANHALLLAHLEDLADLGPATMLIVDEAHQLEDAATSALSTTLDYRAVGNLHAELVVWARTARPGPGRDHVRAAVGNLGMLLDHEQFPRVAAQVFDARSAGTGSVVGSRTVTLASDYAGAAGLGQVRTLTGLVTRLGGQAKALTGSLGGYLGEHRGVLDFFEAERVASLLTATGAVTSAAESIVADVSDIIGRAQAQPAAAAADDVDEDLAGDETDDANDDPALVATDGTDGGDEEDDGLDDTAVDDADDTTTALGELPPGASNRVVYAAELETPRGDLRHYKFTMTSSPIELGQDGGWVQFLATFARTYYVSGTLRVAGRWDFIRTRLGLPASVPTLALDTPFDMAAQAELVCFSDFPSWAEQSQGAMATIAHQLAGYADEVIRPVDELDGAGRGGFDGGALVLTTARSTAGGIAEHLATELRRRGNDTPVRSALIAGNRRAVDEFNDPGAGGGFLVGTRGLWQGVDVADENRLRIVWINKLPFAPFAEPIIEARRAVVAARALAGHAEDPDATATNLYYLPLAALQLRQAAGRLIRSERHRGIIVISDRKLAGATALRRAYRATFLGSLDAGLLRKDEDTGELGAGNVVPMADGWARIWSFLAREHLLDAGRATALCTPEALEEHTLLPYTRKIRQLAMTPAQVAQHTAAGTLTAEVLDRAARIGGLLHLSDEPATLKDSQKEVIAAVAGGANVLALLPTGYGKSFCFQLPALVLPGVTIVISPLVALMTDQALALNRSIGGAVRALVAPLRESSSRAGKTEVADQLQGWTDHGIRMVYVSPERMTQRRFRELVRSAVKAGIVTRIALDEAHTFVQWDDFRPSMGRVELFLAQLRAEHGLALTALTATANRTVHAGLREGVFGLDPDTSPVIEAAEHAAGTLLTVRESPIRPELAIFRRSIATAGPMISAGLAEEVITALDGHAIFYALTVKEVTALAAHLREFLPDGGVRVRRFHGRLTEAEKSAVLTEFREAPRAGEEGFAPLVVVATSAFGLGIDRSDVRTVFCASAPTDLSALYQQIGRAGRDAAGKPAPAEGSGAPANVGLALLTGRGLRTVQWMTSTDLPGSLLTRMGRAVLGAGPVLNASRVADTLIGQDLASGALSADDAAKSRTTETYRAGVVRAFAALAALGAVRDLGDFPPRVTVKAGELLGATPTPEPGAEEDVVEAAVLAAVLALPARTVDGSLHRARLYVPGLDRHLAVVVPGYRELAEDAAGTWQLLADLHDRGVLDVSAAPSRTLVTGIQVDTHTLPAGFGAACSGKAARAVAEVALLADFFSDSGVCANRKLADYFGVADLPAGCCSHAGNRCSACWAAGNWPAGQVKPTVADALETARPRPAGMRTDAAFAARRLDAKVFALIWDVYRGVHIKDLYRTLRGQDSYYNPVTKKRRMLRQGLVNTRYFGSSPAITLAQLEDALARLGADDKVVAVGNGAIWRDADHVARDAAKAAQAAAALALTGAGAP
jgi:ATP-dependent DNA helicase RecQ